MREQLSLKVFVWIQFLCLISRGSSQNQFVQTRLGALKGWTGLSRSGRDYAAFTKIPYAKPPIDSLRFQNPVEFGAWSGEYDATNDMPFCLQASPFTQGNLIGSEDCLYLSVYSPELNSRKLPVLFHVHGGAFKFGHPGPRDMASYLMDEDVVLVTTTYRVGVMGFLSLEDSSIPGNFGLKDQALALKWAKENVDSFGGDPDMITMIGESAGAASVHHLMLSPLTRDLIKGGVSMSGSVTRTWSIASSKGLIRRRTVKLANHFGCSDSSEILPCLQQIDVQVIATADSMLTSEDTIPFRPNIEPQHRGALIPQDPLTKPSNKPWLVGFAEGEFNLGNIELNSEAKDKINEEIDEFFREFLQRRGISKDLNSKVEKIKRKYLNGKPQHEYVAQVAKCWANMTFVYPAIDNLQKHRGPKFAYHQEYRGQKTIADLVDPSDAIPYAGHADEIIFLFNFSSMLKNQLTGRDLKFSIDFIKFVVNFARNQSPATDSLDWRPWNGKRIMRLTSQGYAWADEAFCEELLDTAALWNEILFDNGVKDEL